MSEEKEKLSKEQSEKGKKKPKENLPFCTTASAPEQHRAEDDDEPCDDARSGDYEK
jgi:hypothetical protein